MATRAMKLRHYRQTEIEATEAIVHDVDGRSGALSVRAHAAMRLAHLGRPWRLLDARRDLASSLKLRTAAGGSAAGIGEAEVDYGYSLVLTGKGRDGIALMERGVLGLRTDRSANGLGFLARGLAKLESGAKITGRRDLMVAACDERLRIATDIDALDQAKLS